MGILIDYQGNIYSVSTLVIDNNINNYTSLYTPIDELIKKDILQKINDYNDIEINIDKSHYYETIITFNYKNYNYRFLLRRKQFIYIDDDLVDIINIAHIDNKSTNTYKFENIKDKILVDKLIKEFQSLLKVNTYNKIEEKEKYKKLEILNDNIEYYLSNKSLNTDIFDLFDGIYEIEINKLY